jgi:hypothetical protein
VIKAQIIADSVNPAGGRLTTFYLVYPRFIHSELMTHRAFSRNAASSRAVPVQRMLRRALLHTARPVSWGKNGKGMQSKDELPCSLAWLARGVWTLACLFACLFCWALSKLKVHKQVANRLIEPFLHMETLVSATDWGNFFNLRVHKDAQPEFQALAAAMLRAYLASEPKRLAEGEWHLAFGDRMLSDSWTVEQKLKVCTARAARLSYFNFHNIPSLQDDVRLHDDLLRNGHMCYDEQTEVLTSAGWKPWPTVTVEDQLAAVDIEDGGVSFERPVSLHSYPYRGKLYTLSGQQLDLKVTPNHRLVVSKRLANGSWSVFGFEAAEEVAGSPRMHKKCGVMRNGLPVANPWGIHPVAFARLVGFFVGDGSVAWNNSISFHLKKARKVEWLLGLGLPVSEGSGGKYYVKLPGIGKWFLDRCYDADGNKVLPADYLFSTTEEVSGLFDGLRHSDGSAKRRTWVYYTTSAPLVDQIQAIAHTRGMVASVSSPKSDYYRINFSTRTCPRIETGQKGRSRSYTESWEEHDGMVYCATVTTGALIVRRNRKVSVCGNSPFEHCARARGDDARCGNFRGYDQYRKLLPNENREEYDAEALLAGVKHGEG